MLFKIVMLATYIFGPPQSLNIWGVDFGPNTACLIHRVTRCRGYRGSYVGLLAKKFVITQNGIKLHKCRNPLVPP